MLILPIRLRDLKPSLFCLPLLLLLEITPVDFWLEAQFFDPVSARFSLQHYWLFENLLHDGIKRALLAVGVVVLLQTAWHLLKKTPDRIRWLYLSTSMVLAPSLIAWMKSRSLQACPWDLKLYGGTLPYHGLFDLNGVLGYGCFPAGHASGGYVLLAFYFFWRDSSPRLAQAAVWFGLFVGSLMGISQMIRGAHFLSHTLWTLWLVWLMLLVLDVLFRSRWQTQSSLVQAG